jgi:DNA repair protein RadC
MAISDWPEAQRPRERLIRHGAAKLTDAELLALVLRVGVAGKSAVDLAQEMIGHFGSLNALFAASLQDFSRIHGLGPAKYTLFQAIQELARRGLAEQLEAGVQLNSATLVREYLQLHLARRHHECFMVLYLDVKHRLIAVEELFRGSLSHTGVYPREVVKAALAHNAAALIVAHNHPSGVAQPSEADVRITHALRAALHLIEVKLLDHFVLAGREVYSFAEHGQL